MAKTMKARKEPLTPPAPVVTMEDVLKAVQARKGTGPQTVREVLDVIDEFLLKGGAEAEDLWSVLTALRGPDDNKGPEAYAKNTTTMVVRAKAFPKTAAARSSGRLSFSAGFEMRAKYKWPDEARSHFGWHVDAAAKVLGLLDNKKAKDESK